MSFADVWAGLGPLVGVGAGWGASWLRSEVERRQRRKAEREERARTAIVDLATNASVIALRAKHARGRSLEELAEEGISATVRASLSVPEEIKEAVGELRDTYTVLVQNGGMDRVRDARDALLDAARDAGLG